MCSLDVLDVGEEAGCSMDAGVPAIDKTITSKRSKQHKNRKLKNGRQVSSNKTLYQEFYLNEIGD